MTIFLSSSEQEQTDENTDVKEFLNFYLEQLKN